MEAGVFKQDIGYGDNWYTKNKEALFAAVR